MHSYCGCGQVQSRDEVAVVLCSAQCESEIIKGASLLALPGQCSCKEQRRWTFSCKSAAMFSIQRSNPTCNYFLALLRAALSLQ